jgi:hypothetical protein
MLRAHQADAWDIVCAQDGERGGDPGVALQHH